MCVCVCVCVRVCVCVCVYVCVYVCCYVVCSSEVEEWFELLLMKLAVLYRGFGTRRAALGDGWDWKLKSSW